MHWRIKGCIQKSLGALPGGAWLHRHVQRQFGGLRHFDRELAGKVEDWRLMIGHLRKGGVPTQGARFLEIGTGWYPTFPIALHLAGAAEVLTYDLNAHLRPDLLGRCVSALSRFVPTIAEATGTRVRDVEHRLARVRARIERGLLAGADLGDLLADATGGGIRYRAPADATRTALDDASVDVVFSNSVLEHVPPDVIVSMFREARRVLVPGGVMFHAVNCGDHYAYVDRAIGQLNYLRYSDADWARWNNAFLYQNRMRAHEFVDAATACGFEIVVNTAKPRAERLREVARLPVHPQFAHVPPEHLCITSVDFLARTPAGTVTLRDAG